MRDVFLFAGFDIITHTQICWLAGYCRENHLRLHVLFTRDRANRQQRAPATSTYLHLERKYRAKERIRELERLQATGWLTVQYNIDANSPAVIQSVCVPSRLIAVNIRGFQKFQPHCIAAINQSGLPLVNLHPGRLPHYRGVFSTFWPMLQGDPLAGCTLHQVDAKLDTGAILATAQIELDYTKSVFFNAMRLALPVQDTLHNFLDEICAGRLPAASPQERGQGQYWSYPEKQSLQRAAEGGIVLVDPERDQQLVDELFDCPSIHWLS